jgi:glycyl-tRNA synthetase
VAEAYVEQRQQLEYPWLSEAGGKGAKEKESTITSPQPPSIPAPLLIEIGTEEIPHTDLEDAMSQLRQNVPVMLNELRLEYGEIQVMATPRRIVVHVDELAPTQSNLEELVKGPPAARAFDADGNPTKAAEGFARSKGLDVSDLEVKEIDGGEYVAAVVRLTGQPTAEVLLEALPKLISNIRIIKTMRWNATNVAFSRPIRWLLALHGESAIPFKYAGLTATNATRGLRFNHAENLPVADAAYYFETIKAQGILLNPAERKASIERQIHALAKQVGGAIPNDPGLLLEVTHLVEAPAALLGEFDPLHLELPREALISVMKKHQRYFPVQSAPTPSPGGRGELLPYFITVANKPEGQYTAVVRGNEDVIRARFTDAAYFVREDMKKKLADFLPALDKLTFQAELGSMRDKAQRIEALAGALAPLVGLSPEEQAATARAAQLCKADLATQMVVEMTSLQGVMGRDYALHSGEAEDVAVAIFEHYLPRSSDDISPKTKPGLVVGLADRLDSLAGLFAAGLAPSGNKDPFALRRAALGLVGNLIEWNLPLDLQSALSLAAENLPIEASPASQAECLNFVIERLRHIFLEQGYAHDVVDAIVSAQGHNPALASQAVKQLSEWVGREDWATILPAYSRCVRITRTGDGGPGTEVSAALFDTDAEDALYAALQTAEAALANDAQRPTVDEFLTAIVPMIPAIDRFFEDVLVMVDDERVRANRLALLQRIANLAKGVADMSKLEGF